MVSWEVGKGGRIVKWLVVDSEVDRSNMCD